MVKMLDEDQVDTAGAGENSLKERSSPGFLCTTLIPVEVQWNFYKSNFKGNKKIFEL
jgi:hypothetical protein